MQHFEVAQIFRFCEPEATHFRLRSICVGNQHLKQLIQDKKKWVTKWFPDVIHDLMSGLTTLIFAPILPFQNHFIGLDYIDGIRSSDVWSPIMVGVDDCQRPFITIRSCRIRINTDSHLKASVFTIFQRYTNSQEIWTTQVLAYFG